MTQKDFDWTATNQPPDNGGCSEVHNGFNLPRPAKKRRLDPAPDLPPRDPPIRFRLNVPDCWISLELTEGRNRQVRRMTAAVGHPTLRLVRVRIGAFRTPDLAPGRWRVLDDVDRKALLAS